MKTLGFNFTKINIERFSSKLEELKANTNINILDITSVKADFIKTKEELLSVKFEYIIKYEPDYAKIDFSGDMVLEVEPKKVKEIIKDWKNKETPEEFRIFVFNIILRKANLKALELEDELNLPLHIPLPFIQKENPEKN